jgi:hypothetical protein
MLRAGVCINCAEKIAALILEKAAPRPWERGETKIALNLSVALTVPRLQILHHGSRYVLDRLSALSEDIGSALKGGVKICQRQQLVNEVLALRVTKFALNLGREAATPIQRGFHASLLGRV